jgi:class 3 adenylate cyclase
VIGSETRYARTSDDVDIAYRTFGQGSPYHLFASEWNATVDTRELHPALLRLWRFLARHSTVIAFDRRGIGASERVPFEQLADLDAFVTDMVAVLDALDVEEAVISGEGSSSIAAIAFAARHPERALRLAIVNGGAKAARSEDYPVALFSPEEMDALAEGFAATWGTGAFLSQFAPRLATDPEFVRSCGFNERHVGSPATLRAILRGLATFDARSLIDEVRVPTFVAWTGDHFAVPVEQSRDLAARWPDCTYVEGSANGFYEPDESGPVQAWAEFVVGGRARSVTRRLTTLVFFDVVGSTELIAAAGDSKWSRVLGDLDAWVSQEIHQLDGILVKHTGDGYLARFDSPGDAVRAAVAITSGVHALGVEVRCGVHTGEVELRGGGDVGGMAVHLAARVMSKAGPKQVLVTRTVGDFLIGSEFALSEAGEHELKGVPGVWALFAVRRRGSEA